MGQDDETRALLGRIADGDKTAFWIIWQRHRDDMRRLCLRYMSRMAADADDALSTAMLHAFHQIQKHALSISDLGAWLAVLTRNVCIDLQRKASLERGRLATQEQGSSTQQRESNAAQADPAATLSAEELRRSLRWMSPRLVDVLILKSGGRTCAQIAGALAVSEPAARKRLQRARALLSRRVTASR